MYWWSRRSAASSKTSSCAFSIMSMPGAVPPSSASATRAARRCCRARASSTRPWSPLRWSRGCAGSATRARCSNNGWRGSKRSNIRQRAHAPIALQRTPYFCSGCPHNTSTKVPEGSRAMAGIGCHGMALYVPAARTATITHMGGEGVNWIGQAPFTSEDHIFQNLGDGTYTHSGSAGAARGGGAGRQHHLQDPLSMTRSP